MARRKADLFFWLLILCALNTEEKPRQSKDEEEKKTTKYIIIIDSVFGIRCVRACNCNVRAVPGQLFFCSCRTLFSVLFNLFKPLILFFVVIYDNVLCCDIDELEIGKDTEWLGWLTDWWRKGNDQMPEIRFSSKILPMRCWAGSMLAFPYYWYQLAGNCSGKYQLDSNSTKVFFFLFIGFCFMPTKIQIFFSLFSPCNGMKNNCLKNSSDPMDFFFFCILYLHCNAWHCWYR